MVVDMTATSPSLSARSKRRRGPQTADASAGTAALTSQPLPLPGALVPALVDSSAALADDPLLSPWVDSSHRASGVFMRHVDMLCLGVLAALQNLWYRPDSVSSAGGRGTLVVLTLLLTAFFAGTRSPYPFADGWKLSAKVGCLLLGALSAILTHVTLSLQLSSPTLSASSLNGSPSVTALSILVGIGCIVLLLTLAAGFARSIIRGAKLDVVASAVAASKAAAQSASSAAASAFSSALDAARQASSAAAAAASSAASSSSSSSSSAKKGIPLEDSADSKALPVGYDGGRRYVSPLPSGAGQPSSLKDLDESTADRRLRAAAVAAGGSAGGTINPLRGAVNNGGRSSFAASPFDASGGRKVVVPGSIAEPPGFAGPAAPWLKEGFGFPIEGVEADAGSNGQRIFVSALSGLSESLQAFEDELREAGAQAVATEKGEDFAYSFSLGGAAAAAARRGATGGPSGAGNA